jgi:hypothetical protein
MRGKAVYAATVLGFELITAILSRTVGITAYTGCLAIRSIFLVVRARRASFRLLISLEEEQSQDVEELDAKTTPSMC